MQKSPENYENELRLRARQRARAKLDFYRHLAIYLVVNSILLAVNLLTSPGSLWFYWPLLGWGIAVAVHAWGVFMSRAGSSWLHSMEERELRKLKERAGG